ncbi:MAG: polysaccharide biosynthesis C-terminal domain-containing protein, partial [Methyloprofundus sp.]|nr:polysaccharide biosynthesis C-terminal domain-containing protein [Methyloprofundus sp.]
FHLIYFQSDIILVKYITGDEAAGYYNVAFTIMVAVLLFPGIVYQKFLLPKMHRWAHHDRALFYKVYRQGNVAMLILGLLAMALIWLLSPLAIPFLFGDEYKDAVGLLTILALSAPILFVASSVGATLVTQEHMKTKVKLMGLVAIVNILLNLAFIPFYGAEGAAVSTLMSNVLLLTLYVHYRKKAI